MFETRTSLSPNSAPNRAMSHDDQFLVGTRPHEENSAGPGLDRVHPDERRTPQGPTPGCRFTGDPMTRRVANAPAGPRQWSVFVTSPPQGPPPASPETEQAPRIGPTWQAETRSHVGPSRSASGKPGSARKIVMLSTAVVPARCAAADRGRRSDLIIQVSLAETGLSPDQPHEVKQARFLHGAEPPDHPEPAHEYERTPLGWWPRRF